MKKIMKVNYYTESIFINKIIFVSLVILFISCNNKSEYRQYIERYSDGTVKMMKTYTDTLDNYEFVKYSLEGDSISFGKKIYPYFAQMKLRQDTFEYNFFVEYPNEKTYIEEWLSFYKNKDLLLNQSSYIFLKEEQDSVCFKYIGPLAQEMQLVITIKKDEYWNKADTFSVSVGNCLYLAKEYVNDKKIIGNIVDNYLNEKGEQNVRIRTIHVNLEKKKALQDYFNFPVQRMVLK